jgi:septal ring factor EnvC (AmiA/AmiB activator)
MRRVPWTAAGLALLLAALVLPAAQPERKRSEAEIKAAELKALDERVERTRRQVQKDAADQESLSKVLRDAERAISRVSGDLSALRTQRAERAAARQQLVDERSRRQAEREATEGDLAKQLRAAYFMGRNEPLKLLLNQRNPAEFGRNLTYYGYLGRLRANQIAVISDNIARIDELTVKIDEEDAKLADLELQVKQRLDEREAFAKQRGKALASLQKQARSRADELKRMQAEHRELEQLLEKLRRQAEAAPYDPNSPFSRQLRKLSWPVAGRIAVNFGSRLGDDLLSKAIEIDATRGADVRAVFEGQVAFSDYRKGQGNMIIIDHGNGYLSVYAHNENLFKAKDARVATGEKIATVGDTGGQKRPGLFFQIWHNSKPVDPRPWFRTTAPPPG